MKIKNSFSFFIVIICIIAINLGCIGGRKLWRSYEKKPFDPTTWQKADAIERGTMSHSLIGVQPISKYVGNNRAKIVQTLGEPDKIRKTKIVERDITVLIYEIDLGEPEFVNALQIHIEDEKPIFVNFDVLREKQSLLEIIQRKPQQNVNYFDLETF